ncbi:MAG: phosphate acyltransferase [bacterium]|nr:phosphate acyltransferase [bacterium]
MTQTTPQPLLTWRDIVARAQEISHKRMRRMVVAAAEDGAVLQAVADAHSQGIADAILVGDEDKIKLLADQLKLNISGMTIESVQAPDKAAGRAADIAAAGEADVIMKGFLPTSTLLKAVLLKERNLRRSEVISHCAVLSLPNYPRLLNITDGGMVVSPDLDQKLKIIENAIIVSHALGITEPRIALSAASEHIDQNMPRTLENAIIAQMGKRGQFGSALVDGPFALDTALVPGLAASEGIDSQVAGQADVLIVNSVEEGNITGKALINFDDAVFCGVIVGAAVPVSLVSRTDPPRNKLASVSIAVVLSDYLAQMEEAA